MFPEKLVELCLAAGTDKGNLVLDPFMGAGTTAVVAQRLGRRFLGLELILTTAPAGITPKNECAICGMAVTGFLARFIAEYPHVVCGECKARAINSYGQRPERSAAYDSSTPVFIDGLKCWRQWRFSNYVMMRDFYDCNTRDEFYFRAKRARERLPARKTSRTSGR